MIGKFCSHCNGFMPLLAFSKGQTICRKRKAEIVKRSNDKHRDTRSIYSKQRQQALRKRCIDHYSNGLNKCECCGETNYEFLALDHIQGGGNRQRKTVANFYCWIIRENFPPIFRILCHNCNMAKGMYGYCPHKKEAVCAA